ncbi:hypothetical protein ACX1I2_22030, partial [Yersinia enterocolitica]
RNCRNVASWGVGVLFFFFISPVSENDGSMLSQWRYVSHLSGYFTCDCSPPCRARLPTSQAATVCTTDLRWPPWA